MCTEQQKVDLLMHILRDEQGLDRDVCTKVLRDCGGDVENAAQLLGSSRIEKKVDIDHQPDQLPGAVANQGSGTNPSELSLIVRFEEAMEILKPLHSRIPEHIIRTAVLKSNQDVHKADLMLQDMKFSGENLATRLPPPNGYNQDWASYRTNVDIPLNSHCHRSPTHDTRYNNAATRTNCSIDIGHNSSCYNNTQYVRAQSSNGRELQEQRDQRLEDGRSLTPTGNIRGREVRESLNDDIHRLTLRRSSSATRRDGADNALAAPQNRLSPLRSPLRQERVDPPSERIDLFCHQFPSLERDVVTEVLMNLRGQKEAYEALDNLETAYKVQMRRLQEQMDEELARSHQLLEEETRRLSRSESSNVVRDRSTSRPRTRVVEETEAPRSRDANGNNDGGGRRSLSRERNSYRFSDDTFPGRNDPDRWGASRSRYVDRNTNGGGGVRSPSRERVVRRVEDASSSRANSTSLEFPRSSSAASSTAQRSRTPTPPRVQWGTVSHAAGGGSRLSPNGHAFRNDSSPSSRRSPTNSRASEDLSANVVNADDAIRKTVKAIGLTFADYVKLRDDGFAPRKSICDKDFSDRLLLLSLSCSMEERRAVLQEMFESCGAMNFALELVAQKLTEIYNGLLRRTNESVALDVLKEIHRIYRRADDLLQCPPATVTATAPSGTTAQTTFGTVSTTQRSKTSTTPRVQRGTSPRAGADVDARLKRDGPTSRDARRPVDPLPQLTPAGASWGATMNGPRALEALPSVIRKAVESAGLSYDDYKKLMSRDPRYCEAGDDKNFAERLQSLNGPRLGEKRHAVIQEMFQFYRAAQFALSRVVEKLTESVRTLNRMEYHQLAALVQQERTKAIECVEFLCEKANEKIIKVTTGPLISKVLSDVHALLVDGAISTLDRQWQGIVHMISSVEWQIITGVGKHSGSGGPKLPAAVRNYLVKKNLPFREENGVIYAFIDRSS